MSEHIHFPGPGTYNLGPGSWDLGPGSCNSGPGSWVPGPIKQGASKSGWTLGRPICLDPYDWTHMPRPICPDPCKHWTHRIGPIFPDPSNWTHMPGPTCLDPLTQKTWTHMPRPICLVPYAIMEINVPGLFYSITVQKKEVFA